MEITTHEWRCLEYTQYLLMEWWQYMAMAIHLWRQHLELDRNIHSGKNWCPRCAHMKRPHSGSAYLSGWLYCLWPANELHEHNYLWKIHLSWHLTGYFIPNLRNMKMWQWRALKCVKYGFGWLVLYHFFSRMTSNLWTALGSSRWPWLWPYLEIENMEPMRF